MTRPDCPAASAAGAATALAFAALGAAAATASLRFGAMLSAGRKDSM